MKNELIKIETREGFGRCVSLRALHEGLGIKTQFTKWAIRMIEYGFTENIDFILISQKRLINNPKNPFIEQTDYIITTDMAKEICMIQRSDIGREFRKYFIECEKQLKEVVQKPQTQLPTDYLSALKALVASEEEKQRLTKKIEEDKPKVEYTDNVLQAEGLITTTAIAKDFGMSARKLNGILNKEGIQYKQGGQWFLYSQYQDKGFMQSSTDKEGHISSKWTQTGRKFIIEFLLDLGYALNKDINE